MVQTVLTKFAPLNLHFLKRHRRGCIVVSSRVEVYLGLNFSSLNKKKKSNEVDFCVSTPKLPIIKSRQRSILISLYICFNCCKLEEHTSENCPSKNVFLSSSSEQATNYKITLPTSKSPSTNCHVPF